MISLLSKLKFISEASDMSVILNYLYYSGRGRGNYNYSNRSYDYRSQPFGNPGRMPDRFANILFLNFMLYCYYICPCSTRWEDYANIGEPIQGLPIVACRVPLNEV